MRLIYGAVCAAILLVCNPAKAERASWYDECLTKACLTASGERYNPEGMTAAHRTLPFGTMVRVTRKDNGKSVVLRINDRGPAKWTGNDIDLSRAAARHMGLLVEGVTQVTVEVLR